MHQSNRNPLREVNANFWKLQFVHRNYEGDNLAFSSAPIKQALALDQLKENGW